MAFLTVAFWLSFRKQVWLAQTAVILSLAAAIINIAENYLVQKVLCLPISENYTNVKSQFWICVLRLSCYLKWFTVFVTIGVLGTAFIQHQNPLANWITVVLAFSLLIGMVGLFAFRMLVNAAMSLFVIALVMIVILFWKYPLLFLIRL